jgi:multisubunit Na+/H+ antiporter MnhE subunit
MVWCRVWKKIRYLYFIKELVESVWSGSLDFRILKPKPKPKPNNIGIF